MGSLTEVQNHPDTQYNLLSVLGNRDQNDVSLTLLEMSTSPETCAAMRSSGCLPLIVRLLYAPDSGRDMKKHVSLALHNIVNSNMDEAQSKLEGRVLSLLETVRHYCDNLAHLSNGSETENQNINIGMTVATILRLSFDGDQRRAMSLLGGIPSIAYLIQVLRSVYGDTDNSIHCIMLKRYASMALTNLTSGHSSNKTLLCSLKQCMHALVAQLTSQSEELQQATASVIRNLSWKADAASKQVLRETGAILVLMKVAMIVKKESTLISVLSALWNLSSNCNLNKVELCAVRGALGFLTHTLNYKSPSQSFCVIENAGGILRNVSSHVAEREHYRAILREHDCLQIVTQHLTSPSTRVVGNACIILWNLSFDSAEDQYTLWMLGAPNLLRNLIHSKHRLIALGSSAALKNLLSGRPEGDNLLSLVFGPASVSLPTCGEASHRRRKTVEEELDEVLTESPLKKDDHVTVTGRRDDKFVFTVTDVEKTRQQRRTYHKSHSLSRSGSKEKLSSSHHETSHNGVVKNSPTGDRKHSSNVDLSASEDSLQVETNDEKFNGKYACLLMKDDTERDLNVDNEALSTVDELLEVIKDMASLQLYEDAVNHNADLKREVRDEESGKSVEVRPETNDLKTEQLETSEAQELLEQCCTGEDSSLVKRESLVGNIKKESSVEEGEKSSVEEGEKSSVEEGEKSSVEEGEKSSVEEGEKSCLEESDKSSPEMRTEGQCLYLPYCEETRSTVKERPLVSPEDYSTPKNVSLMSPRSVEDLPTDELTNLDSFSVKNESSSEELQPSLEDLPSDDVKKEVATEEDLGQSLEELTFEEGVKDETLVYTNDDEGPSELIGNAHYALDISLGDTEEKNSVAEGDSSSEEYGDYAETDLDQLTDYSLQYGEEGDFVRDEIDQENKQEASLYVTGVPIMMHDDTLKTYCTEGTPFVTPFNFSTATSMSDLRAESSIKDEMDEIGSEMTSEDHKDNPETTLVAGSFKEKLVDGENNDIPLDRVHLVDSDLMSQREKPVQFFDDGTSGQCISRFSSVSSWRGDDSRSERAKIEEGETRGTGIPYTNRENEQVYHDTPPHSKCGDEFSGSLKNGDEPVILPSNVGKRNVFEDTMITFKDEATPPDYSYGTSLSSLSFDDEPNIHVDVTPKPGTSSQKVSLDLTPRRLHSCGENHSDATSLNSARLTSHQVRREKVFPTQTSILDRNVVSPQALSPEGVSSRIPTQQETRSFLSDRSSGEDAGAFADTTYLFCTEGTPANISQAGSHSDLFGILLTPHRKKKHNEKIDESSDDNLSCSDYCENIVDNCTKSEMPEMTKTEQSNGKMQSKTQPDGNGNSAGKVESGECEHTDKSKQLEDTGEKGKVVTFDREDHYVGETPMMFSRTSSLASLSSFDHPSIVDDRSSIISDFSRLTSRADSPCEIPDSFSQMGSTSSRHSKTPSVAEASDLGRTSKLEFSDSPQLKPVLSGLWSNPCLSFDEVGQWGVFKDDVKSFKVEDTPVQFSRATSLSSLSICDHAIPAEEVPVARNERENLTDAPGKQEDGHADDESDKSSLILESEGEDDDAILNACISIGRQQTRKASDSNPTLFNKIKDRNPSMADAVRAKCKTDDSSDETNRSTQQVNQQILSSTSGGQLPKPNQVSMVKMISRDCEPAQEGNAFDDVTHRYLTEDTPTLSHAASQSDLSVLSFNSGKDDARAGESERRRTLTELSDDVFSVSDSEGMLAQCIQAGMPKKNTHKKRVNHPSAYSERGMNVNSLKHPLSDDIEIPRQQCRDDRDVFHNLSSKQLPRDDRSSGDNPPPRHPIRDDRSSFGIPPPRHPIRDDRSSVVIPPPRHPIRDDKNSVVIPPPRHPIRDDRISVHIPPSRLLIRNDRNGNESPRLQSTDDKNGVFNLSTRQLPRDDRSIWDILSLRLHSRDDKNGVGNPSSRYPTRDHRNGIESLRVPSRDDRNGIHSRSLRHPSKDDRNGVDNILPRHQSGDDRNGMGNHSLRYPTRDDRNGIENFLPRHLLKGDVVGVEHLSLKHQFRDDRNTVGNLSPKHQPRDDRNGMENFTPRQLFRDDKSGFESFNDRPRSNLSSQQLSSILHKPKPTSRPMSAHSHVSSSTLKSSHSRKSKRVAQDVEPRRMEHAGAFEDTMYRFSTEDTPANISHAGSNTDISVLSIPDDDTEFNRDFHKHNIRQHSFHYLSHSSPDDSDSENILLKECIKSGMPKAKSSRPMSRPSHPTAPTSQGHSHHAVDLNSNPAHRSLNQVLVQQRHNSRSTSRSNRNIGSMRRSVSQSDRPYNHPFDVRHGLVMAEQSNSNDAILNRNVAAAGMWSNSATLKLPFNREKEVTNVRTSPNNHNNNPHASDSGWEMDPSIRKDSQAFTSLLLSNPNARWHRRMRSTSPNHRRFSEGQSSAHTSYSRENSRNLPQSSNDSSSAVLKAAGVLASQQTLSPPPGVRLVERQRTFTKLEPSSQTHLSSPSSRTKIPVPAQGPSKPPGKTTSYSVEDAVMEQAVTKGMLKSKPSVNPQPKKTHPDRTSDRVKTSRSGPWTGKTTPTSTPRLQGPVTSSTPSLVFKQNTTERRSFRVPKQSGLEDKRSNSFSSITSSASSKSSVRLFKKEVSSKVACVWKRTDSSGDVQGKTNNRNGPKGSDSEIRRMERSATFEGLPRNVDKAKINKVKDDTQVKSCNLVDRPKKTSQKNRFQVDKKEEEMNKVKARNKSSENNQGSRDDKGTSVINRHDNAVSSKVSLKPDQNKSRVSKV